MYSVDVAFVYPVASTASGTLSAPNAPVVLPVIVFVVSKLPVVDFK